MPDEGKTGRIPGIIKINPEPSRAIFAVETAAHLIEAAKTELENRRYEEAYEDAKNAIRMASAAMMYNDGYVANNIEGAYEYMDKKYGEKVMVKEWKTVEVRSPENRGIIDRLLEMLRLKKRKEDEMEIDARKALHVAEVFVESGKALLSAGAVPVWERTRKE